MLRGGMTPEIKSHELGADINTDDIKLIAYLHYCMHNFGIIDRIKLSSFEPYFLIIKLVLRLFRHWG